MNWKECKPGNMPEDLCNESEIQIHGGTGVQYLGPFIICNISTGKEHYGIGTRYRKRSNDRWTWSGLHPNYWSKIEPVKSNF